MPALCTSCWKTTAGQARGHLQHDPALPALTPRVAVAARGRRMRARRWLGARRAPPAAPLTFSMELMVTPAAQETTMWRASMSGPTSSRMKGMMGGFTARKRTSLLFTVSLLLTVKFTPIFCSGRGQTGGLWAGAARPPGSPPRPRTHPQPAHGGQLGVRGARRDLVRSQDPCGRHRAAPRQPGRDGTGRDGTRRPPASPAPRHPPAAVKPLAKAKASCPAPMNPTLMVRIGAGAERSGPGPTCGHAAVHVAPRGAGGR